MNNIVFTFTGKANSGKDTCGLMVKKYCEEQGKKVFMLSFADYLKALCARNFGYDDNNKEDGRAILQSFGTDIVKKRDPLFWVSTVYHTIDVLRNDYDVFIICDVRFEDERNPYPWRIGYPIFNIYVKNDNLNSKLGEEERKHESEYLANNPDLEKFHFIVDNSGSLEETYEAVKQLVDMVLEKQKEFLESIEKVGEEVEVLQN